MKVKHLIDSLNMLVLKNQDVLEFDLVYSNYDEFEFMSYNDELFDPSVGEYKNGKFSTDSEIKNAVCIN